MSPGIKHKYFRDLVKSKKRAKTKVCNICGSNYHSEQYCRELAQDSIRLLGKSLDGDTVSGLDNPSLICPKCGGPHLEWNCPGV